MRESSQVIASALVSFLESIGVSAHYVRQSVGHKRTKAYFQKVPCFDSVARHEIVGRPGKIVASAQRRIETTFLQHGAIKIAGIAPHPALPVNISNTGEKLQPLESKHFQEYAVRFRRQFELVLDIRCEQYQTDENEEHEIMRRIMEVRKNALKCRDIIKQ